MEQFRKLMVAWETNQVVPFIDGKNKDAWYVSM
jgi:hypothetical protein